MAERIAKPGEFYRHFKNKIYQIVAVAEHSETGEAMVVYQALYGDFRTYVRPLEMFMSEVDHDKYPGVSQKYRFEQIGREELGRTDALERKRAKGLSFGTSEETGKVPAGTFSISSMLSDFEDYEEANLLHGQARVVLSRDGRAGKDEDELWESLTDEAVQAAGEADGEETETVNPRFLDFLEARTYESKAVILESMKEELDNELIDGLAMAVDVEIPAGSVDERYRRLRQCLETMAKYEDTRLR